MAEEIFASKPQNRQGPWDVAIIGSGPAALTAAVYTTRGAASTFIIGGEKWGGQLMLTTLVDNYPGFPDGIQGPDLMIAMRKQAERFGAEFVQKNASRVDFSKKPFEIEVEGNIYSAISVIIATGALTKWLDAPGVQEFIGRGVSSCAPCDAPFFKDKRVAVVGGGDAAMEEANVLTKYASEVTVIHRRDTFRASVAMQKKVMTNPKVKILWNTEVKEVVGTNKVEKVILVNNKDQTTSELAIDGLFVAVGHKPDSDIFKGPIEMDEKGYIKVRDHTMINLPGVFVAGDVHDEHYKQAVTAAGFGCMAGMRALRYLEEVKEQSSA
jgi:thioredoxin reductase (NADPH)